MGETSSTRLERQINQILFVTFLGLYAWLPIPFASKPYWASGLMIGVSFFLMAAYSIQQAMMQANVPETVKYDKWPLLLFVLWLGYQLAQTISLPIELLQKISPETYQILIFAFEGKTPEHVTLSLSKASTYRELLQNSAYVALFFLCLALVNTRSRVEKTIWLLVVVGTLESFSALVNYYTQQHTRTFGTFLNANHFAGFLEMIIPLGIGLVLAKSRFQDEYPNWRSRIVGYIGFVMTPWLLVYFALLMMVSAFLYSASRAGLFAFVISMAFMLVCLFLTRSGAKQSVWKITCFPLLILITVIVFGSGNLLDRIERSGLESNRAYNREITYSIIADFPLSGTGAGTWHIISPKYKDERLRSSKITLHAHNDYIELLSNQGFLGFSLLGGAVSWLLWRIMGSLFRIRNRRFQILQVAILTGLLSLAVHSFFDFHFHVPANAAYFFLLLGLGSVIAYKNNRVSVSTSIDIDS